MRLSYADWAVRGKLFCTPRLGPLQLHNTRQHPVTAPPRLPIPLSGFLLMALTHAMHHALHVIEVSPQGLKEEVGDDTKQVQRALG